MTATDNNSFPLRGSRHRWFLVACRVEGRILEAKLREKLPRLIQTVPHPEGRMKNRQLGSDKPGRTFDSGKQGFGRHSMSTQVEPQEHENDRFAKQLASLLNASFAKKHFEELVLVAEPGFMGKIKAHLSTQMSKAVVVTVDKDFGNITDSELPKYLVEAGLA